MDQRIESFLTDVLALAGKDVGEVREGVRAALADCEALFRVQEAARICRALCRSRVVAELHQRRGTQPPRTIRSWYSASSTVRCVD